MITILAVGRDTEALATFGSAHPSVEVVTASGPEEALETLARNRRIDAVLILGGSGARETARLISEEDPGAPPLFAAANAGEVPGARLLTGVSGAGVLEELLRALSPESPENE